jgi:diguanylate cyclase (GGDEF)-like protein
VQSSEKPKKVLLVDDDRQQFLLIGYLLSEAHYDEYRLIWCQDLEKGLQHIEHDQCDVVLLDYHWGINCTDFVHRAQLLNNRIPIIIMTDDMDLEVDRKAISEGASDYLVKESINSEILERTIRYSIERKKIERHLDHLAHYDYLTGLPNRVLFLDRLNQAVNLAQRSKHQFTLMYIDLNDFKVVNDNYGHDVGDKLLKEFANRLLETVRRSDTVARIGGDEFTILLNNMGSSPKIIQLAQKLIDSIEQPFVLANNILSVGCSIGIAVFPKAGDHADSLQRNADIAMYQAKQTGNSCYRFFLSQRQESTAIENLSPDELRLQIDNKKLEIRYTPRVDLNTQKILGVVISPIWEHDGLGVQYYKEFASLMANGETIKLLTEWMLETSLRETKLLYKKHGLLFSYAIRRPELQSSRFGPYVKKITKDYGVAINHIEFNFLRKKECMQKVFLKECIENVSDMGAIFSLSDFGEDTLSLIHMHNYDISALHFSANFLKNAMSNTKEKVLLESLIILAHRLGRALIANGLDDTEEVRFMQTLQCDQAQGGIFGESLSYSQLEEALKKNNLSLEKGDG